MAYVGTIGSSSFLGHGGTVAAHASCGRFAGAAAVSVASSQVRLSALRVRTVRMSTRDPSYVRKLVLLAFAGAGAVHNSPFGESVRPVVGFVKAALRMVFARVYSPFWSAVVFTVSMVYLGLMIVQKMDAQAESEARSTSAFALASASAASPVPAIASPSDAGAAPSWTPRGFQWNIQAPPTPGTQTTNATPEKASVSSKDTLSPSKEDTDTRTSAAAGSDSVTQSAESEKAPVKAQTPASSSPKDPTYKYKSAVRKSSPSNAYRASSGTYSPPLDKPRDWNNTLDRRKPSQSASMPSNPSNPSQTSVVQQYYLPRETNNSVYDFMQKKNKWR
ncbi:hypothetical protein FVE85_8427 [Porphyridium purpureum]|uniref:Uncharacterized protein n=1 Tax=Porphyridium purpureum TaxID=35688 RepID=A0A5J4YLC6_PORPP|nr:hypothetical protein FVE85_8427 [Porphyridium purpureum]|eukprot:POR3518..scf244_11